MMSLLRVRSEHIEVLIVFVRDAENFGVFVFSREVLRTHGLLASESDGGDASTFRVFPPWTRPERKKDKLAQTWQSQLFLPITEGSKYDEKAARALFVFA
jgi:hypothetical protein